MSRPIHELGVHPERCFRSADQMSVPRFWVRSVWECRVRQGNQADMVHDVKRISGGKEGCYILLEAL